MMEVFSEHAGSLCLFTLSEKKCDSQMPLLVCLKGKNKYGVTSSSWLA